MISHRYIFLRWCSFLGLFSVVHVMGTGCRQHTCDCGFEWDHDDRDLTLRYEFIAGLVGAFSPLVLAGLGLLSYKLCARSAATAAEAAKAGSLAGGAAPMAASYPYGAGGVGGGHRGGNNNNSNNNLQNYPTSLYGESEDGFTATDPPSEVGGRGHRPGTVNSRYTNIHRNVKSDRTNQWLRNVNLRKY